MYNKDMEAVKKMRFETEIAAANWVENGQCAGGGAQSWNPVTAESEIRDLGDDADQAHLDNLRRIEAAGRFAVAVTDSDAVEIREFASPAEAEAARIEFWLEIARRKGYEIEVG